MFIRELAEQASTLTTGPKLGATIKPVDITATAIWDGLGELADNTKLDPHRAFANDPEWTAHFAYTVGNLHADLSKNLANDDVVTALLRLTEQTDVASRQDAMFRDEHVNIIEDRTMLHATLRLSRGTELTVDRQDVVANIHEVLSKMFVFADKVHSDEQVGAIGRPIRTVVNVGISGSNLGPMTVYKALLPHKQQGLEYRFISGIDPTDYFVKAVDLDPETTLFVVASKTFTILETLTNVRTAHTWLLDALVTRGAVEDTKQVCREAITKHFAAVSIALDKMTEFGIDPANAFGSWNWAGDRYSVGSTVDLPVAIAIGPGGFHDFLADFHTVDQCSRIARPAHNVPLLIGLLDIRYINFLDVTNHAVLLYMQHLHRLVAHLQQLTIESSGKSVRWDGFPVTCKTGEAFQDEPGTNGQYAFYQLTHQDTQLIPAGFIAVANPPHAIRDGDMDVHDMFLVSFSAQTTALASRKTEGRVREEDTLEEIVPMWVFSKNRPVILILTPTLTSSMMEQLTALYEYITFMQEIVWGIDSFDQQGVELDRKLALKITPAVFGDTHALARQDAPTRALASQYLGNRR